MTRPARAFAPREYVTDEAGEPVEIGAPHPVLMDDTGTVYRARERGTFLTVTARGLIYLHGRYADIILNGGPTTYRHDGAGGLILSGNVATARLSLDQGRNRLPHIAAWRARMAAYPREVEAADVCRASLEAAIEDAEWWLSENAERDLAPSTRGADMPGVSEPGVPLSHYLEHEPGQAVRFECRDCQLAFEVPVAEVVGRLKALGVGGEATGVREVARHVRRPCARCGGLRFETRPALHPAAARGPKP